MLTGIDVSHHNGIINFSKVSRAGIAFMFQKATQGTKFIDPILEKNLKMAQKHGIHTGCYHYFEDTGNAAAQAKHFLATVESTGGFEGQLPPVLDVEERKVMTAAQYSRSVQAWLDVVSQTLQCKPIVYMNPDYANNHLSHTFGRYPLWLANYTEDGPFDNPASTPWTNWSFWQYTDRGTCPGIRAGGTVDMNVFNGSARDLAVLLLP